ncbi:MAG: helix-turn-helix domain-containing protein, partial [Streptosporangiaceae bacterium]
MTGDLGHALREARKQSGMSFSKFARLTGYSESHLRSVENGHRTITLSVARAYDTVLKAGNRFQAVVADAPLAWDPAGTLSAVSRVLSRSELDRRAFVIASGAALAGIAGSWKLALDHPSPLHGNGTRQVSDDLITNIEQRLGLLRHLDDELGSSQLARLARGELGLIARVLRDGSYTDTAGRRLYSLAAEAGRQAAWDYFDQGEHGTAQAYFETALRASATAGDQIAGAYALSFLAVQCYSTRQPQTAVSLLETAQGTA